MKYIVIFVAALGFFEFANAYCCFRDPWTLPSTPCECAMSNSCANKANNCGCNQSTKCFRNPCNVCEYTSTSCGCQCSSNCGCGCQSSSKCDCGCTPPIYFPEVEYPCTIIDINPFAYGTCQCY